MIVSWYLLYRVTGAFLMIYFRYVIACVNYRWFSVTGDLFPIGKQQWFIARVNCSCFSVTSDLFPIGKQQWFITWENCRCCSVTSDLYPISKQHLFIGHAKVTKIRWLTVPLEVIPFFPNKQLRYGTYRWSKFILPAFYLSLVVRGEDMSPVTDKFSMYFRFKKRISGHSNVMYCFDFLLSKSIAFTVVLFIITAKY
jgi:hypothetical protein